MDNGYKIIFAEIQYAVEKKDFSFNDFEHDTSIVGGWNGKVSYLLLCYFNSKRVKLKIKESSEISLHKHRKKKKNQQSVKKITLSSFHDDFIEGFTSDMTYGIVLS